MESEALVLRSKTSGENDLWVDFLTPALGRLHGIARHGRKSHKRFGTVLESMNWVRVRGRDAGGWVSLEEAALVKPWLRLDAHLPLLMAAFHAIELVRQLVPERSPDARVFDLLAGCLADLDRATPDGAAATVARFEFRILEASGYAPNLRACLSCGRPRTKEGRFFFVFREGGVYCAGCLPLGTPFEPLSRAAWPAILAQFVEYQLGKPLKTRKLLTDKAFCG